MSARDAAHGIDGHRDRQAPADGDDDPAAILAFAAVEHDVRDDTVAEEDQDGGADEFSEIGIHGFRSFVICDGFSSEAIGNTQRGAGEGLRITFSKGLWCGGSVPQRCKCDERAAAGDREPNH